ncbi:HTH gntR-type domain-containing protein OS=Streptomyces fumanus OX=67302 GN=GCM10018772_02690 PE=4 SV=1 [Streptomyces fumanus]
MKSFLAEGETSRVTAAELITPPLYVAEIFDLEAGDQVVRREGLAGRGKTRTVFAVTWYPAPFAALVPDLLNTARGPQSRTDRPGPGSHRAHDHPRPRRHARRPR